MRKSQDKSLKKMSKRTKIEKIEKEIMYYKFMSGNYHLKEIASEFNITVHHLNNILREFNGR